MRFREAFDNLPATVQDSARHIVAAARPEKLILFGSHARGDARGNSDYDFCVQNKACTDGEWTALLVELSEAPLSLRMIDLVEFEKLGEDYRRQIDAEGLLVYG